MKPRKKKSNNSILLVVLILICVAVIGFSAYKLISIQWNYSSAQDEYDDIRRHTEPKEKQKDEPAAEPDVPAEPDQEGPEDDKTHVPEMIAPISVDHEALETMNPDYTGWLYIEALDISYPIMQGPDEDYYLHRTFEGNDRYAGSLFINSGIPGDFSIPHTIIYGHNMKDMSMFGTLKLFSDKAMYNDSDMFWVLTKEKDYCYRIFSIHTCFDESDTYMLFSGPSQSVSDFIRNMLNQSEIRMPDTEYDDNSKVVTLSTCLYETGPERYVVQGIRLN